MNTYNFLECPAGTYKPRLDPGDSRSCIPCPEENQTSPPGSYSALQVISLWTRVLILQMNKSYPCRQLAPKIITHSISIKLELLLFLSGNHFLDIKAFSPCNSKTKFSWQLIKSLIVIDLFVDILEMYTCTLFKEFYEKSLMRS